MRAGDCPCCGVSLDWIFGDPEMESAFALCDKFTLDPIEVFIERFRGTMSRFRDTPANDKGLSKQSLSCPSCRGRVGVTFGHVGPAFTMGRRIQCDVEFGLVVAS